MRASVCMSLLAGLLVVALHSVGAYEVPEAHYPTLPQISASPEGFIPEGWTAEIRSEGDLNGDRLADLLLILRQDDPANIVENDPDSPGVQTLDTNPRILAVAFAEKDGGYVLRLQNQDFIPRNDSPTIDDPFASAQIADGEFHIELHYWANAGSWYTDDTTFDFQYQSNAFRLVGYHDFTTKRNTGETWDLVVDYIKHEAEMTTGSFSDDAVENTTIRKPLPESPLLSIDEIGAGQSFNPAERDLSWWEPPSLDG